MIHQIGAGVPEPYPAIVQVATQTKQAAAAKLDPKHPLKQFFDGTFEQRTAFSSVGKGIYGDVQDLKSSIQFEPCPCDKQMRGKASGRLESQSEL